MDRKYKIALVLLLLLALASVSVQAANPVPVIANSYRTFLNWIPVILAAIMLSFALTSIYYMVGVALNNPRVKAMAVTEFWQAVGTAVLVVLIIWIISIFGTSLTSTKTLVVSPTNIYQICTASLSQSQFQFTNSIYTYWNGQPSPTNTVCSDLIEPAATNNHVSANLDYGLAATYVILANMTNQTLGNLNSLYYIEGTSGWIRTFKPIVTFCVGEFGGLPEGIAEDLLECSVPVLGGGVGEPIPLKIQYSYTPYVAYYYQRIALPPVETAATLIFYLSFLQMIVALIVIYWWPFLLAAGILLRTFSYTRRAGGLIVAVVIVCLVIYPIIYLFEYTSLGNGNQLCQYTSTGIVSGQPTPTPAATGNPAGCVELIGANSLPTMVINELPLACPGPYADNLNSQCQDGNTDSYDLIQYQLNFFVFPKISEVLNYHGCYPDDSNLLAMEFLYASNYLIPFVGLVSGAHGALGTIELLLGLGSQSGGASAVPTPPDFITGGQQSDYNCFLPQNFAATDLDIFKVYGIMSVTGFIIPLLNVLISLSAIVGLSGLLGGDTNIIGLGRFI